MWLHKPSIQALTGSGLTDADGKTKLADDRPFNTIWIDHGEYSSASARGS